MNIKEIKFAGWTVVDNSPDIVRCVVCVAPHTSNWDFIVGMMASRRLGRRIHFLMKSDWFVGPLRYLFEELGGIAVDRSSKNGLVDQLVERFALDSSLCVAFTPEGTRSANPHWKSGFYQVACKADVPLLLAKIDFQSKQIEISEPIEIQGDYNLDIAKIKEYFKECKGKNPDNFVL